MEVEPFAAVGGRKFVLTVGGCVLVTILALFGSHATDAAMQAIGAMVLVFNGANAAVTWGSMRATTRDDTPRAGKAIEDGDAV